MVYSCLHIDILSIASNRIAVIIGIKSSTHIIEVFTKSFFVRVVGAGFHFFLLRINVLDVLPRSAKAGVARVRSVDLKNVPSRHLRYGFVFREQFFDINPVGIAVYFFHQCVHAKIVTRGECPAVGIQVHLDESCARCISANLAA